MNRRERVHSTTPDQILTEVLNWRSVLDRPGVPHTDAWATLEYLCQIWRSSTPPGQLMSMSRLTPSYYPVEFIFRSGSDSLSYIAEPGSPSSYPMEKWRIIRTIADVGTTDLEHAQLLSALRVQPGQRYGCWLRVQQNVGDVHYTIYHEVTPISHALVRRHILERVPSLDDVSRITPQLVGQALPTGAAEYYCEITDPSPSTLHAILAAVGAAGQLRLITDSLAALATIPTDQLHQRLRLGMSYRAATDQPAVATLFVHTAQFGGSNRQIRQRLLNLAQQCTLDLTQYERATASLERWDPPIPLHGLVGLAIEPQGNVSLSIGVRPPPRKLDEPTDSELSAATNSRRLSIPPTGQGDPNQSAQRALSAFFETPPQT